MLILLSALLSTLGSMFRSRAVLELENMALRLSCAIITCAFMLRPFPASTRDAGPPGQLYGALDGLAEAGVDARFLAARVEAGPEYPVPGSCETRP
jgi:hypothetical protein